MSDLDYRLLNEPTKLLQRLADAEAQLASKQAKIDALMFEYCPDEMTDEQVEEWCRHQVADESVELQAILDKTD